MKYLSEQGLLKCQTMRGRYGLTSYGIDYVEAEELDQRPELALPATFQVTQNFHGSTGAVQVGSDNVANVQQTIGVPADLVDKFAELRGAVEALELEDRTEALEFIETLEEQAASDQPKPGLVRVTGEALKEHLPGWVPTIMAILTWIASS